MGHNRNKIVIGRSGSGAQFSDAEVRGMTSLAGRYKVFLETDFSACAYRKALKEISFLYNNHDSNDVVKAIFAARELLEQYAALRIAESRLKKFESAASGESRNLITETTRCLKLAGLISDQERQAMQQSGILDVKNLGDKIEVALAVNMEKLPVFVRA